MRPPFLMTSDVIDKLTESRDDILKEVLKTYMPRGTRILKMPESDITATSGMLRRLLGMRK